MSEKLPIGTTYQSIPELTQKGELITYDDIQASTFILSPDAANGKVLTTDNTLSYGIRWADAPGGITLMTKGDLLSHDGTTEVILSVDPNDGYILQVDSSSTDGIKWDTVDNVLPSNVKGDLITNDGVMSIRLPVGTNGQMIIADSTQTEGLKWDDIANNTLLTTKGDLLSHNSTAERFPVGTNGQILTADSGESVGLKWNDQISVPITSKGDILSNDSVNNVRLAVGTNGQFLTADSGETSGLKWTTSSGSSVLTTKGDLLGYDTGDVRIPVGANGQIVVADSTQSEGIKWDDVANNTVLTTKGDVMGHDGSSAVRLAVGTDNQLLISDSAETEGLSWKDISEVIGASNITWRAPVIAKQTTPPGGPSLDDRYVVLPTGTGAWGGQDNDIAQWNGASWDFTTPAEGWALWVDDDDMLCVFTGTAWVKLGFTIDHFNLQNIGTNTHVQIDSHISNTNNPHSVTLDQTTVATTKGDLLGYNGATSTRIAVGSNDEILIADSVQTSGVKWGSALSTVGATTKADIITGDGSNAIIFSGAPVNGQILSAQSAQTSGLLWIDDVNKTLTSKGDLLTRDATNEARLGVGANGQIIVADSAQTEGIKWDNVANNTVLTTKGDVMGHDGSSAVRLGIGSNGQVLSADNAETSGLKWITSSSGSTPKTWIFYHTTGVGVDGGAATSAAWTTRTLNTPNASNPGGVVLAANQITVAATGNYKFRTSQTFGNVGDVQIRVRNITAGSTISGSTSSLRSATSNGQVVSDTQEAISAMDVLEIQYYTQSAGGTDGLGNAGPAGSGEINVLAILTVSETF